VPPVHAAERDLVALVGSRICHDLINPLGAVGNGLELMQLSGQGDSAEFGLVADSAARATARIRFFRIAFGTAPPGASLSRREIAEVLDDWYRGGRTAVVWGPSAEVPRAEVRLAFLAVLCVEMALPLGGEIAVAWNGHDWHLSAQGPRAVAATPAWAHLVGRGARFEPTPAEVHFVLLRLALDEAGRAPALETHEGRLALSF